MDAVFQYHGERVEPYPGDPLWVSGKWYHCTETWAAVVGPFDTEKEARAGLARYAEELG